MRSSCSATGAPRAVRRSADRRRRMRGSGGVFPVRRGCLADRPRARPRLGDGSSTSGIENRGGDPREAEVALARLKVADHEKRLPSGGTKARSVAAAFEAYEQAVEVGLIQLAPSTAVTVRSAHRVMASVELLDGRSSARIRLSQLQPGRTSSGSTPQCARRVAGSAWIRRCATVLSRSLDLARKARRSSTPTPVPRRHLDPGRTFVTKPFAPGTADVKKVDRTGSQGRSGAGRHRHRARQHRHAHGGAASAPVGGRGSRRRGDQRCRGHFGRWSRRGNPPHGDENRLSGGIHPAHGHALAALRRQQERRVDLVGDEPRSHYVFPGDIDGWFPCARTR